MLLTFLLVLLPLFPFIDARTDQLDNRANYLRKMKKDTYFQNDGDQGLISTGMMKPFDMSENGLGFGDWINQYNATASSGRLGLNGVDAILRVSTFSDSDDLYSTDDNEDAPFTNNSDPNASSDLVGWNNGATAVSAKRSGTITFKIPDTTHVGDTLFLFLSRTDGILPLELENWNRGAECFKSFNRQSNCMREVNCIVRDGPFCREFKRGNESGTGKDLATVVFYRHVEDNDPCEWTLNLPGSLTPSCSNVHILTVYKVVSVPNVNRAQPILRVAGTSCDRKRESEFPSVYGEEGNLVLLSQSFDDNAVLGQFRPPDGTDLVGWINDLDEAGFLYGKKLSRSGLTGNLVTQGIGGALCKDALLSLIVNIDNSAV
ncbi:hypothetical protein ACHAWX_005668 [Stephanocyclus meneghinianus]